MENHDAYMFDATMGFNNKDDEDIQQVVSSEENEELELELQDVEDEKKDDEETSIEGSGEILKKYTRDKLLAYGHQHGYQ